MPQNGPLKSLRNEPVLIAQSKPFCAITTGALSKKHCANVLRNGFFLMAHRLRNCAEERERQVVRKTDPQPTLGSPLKRKIPRGCRCHAGVALLVRMWIGERGAATSGCSETSPPFVFAPQPPLLSAWTRIAAAARCPLPGPDPFRQTRGHVVTPGRRACGGPQLVPRSPNRPSDRRWRLDHKPPGIGHVARRRQDGAPCV